MTPIRCSLGEFTFLCLYSNPLLVSPWGLYAGQLLSRSPDKTTLLRAREKVNQTGNWIWHKNHQT